MTEPPCHRTIIFQFILWMNLNYPVCKHNDVCICLRYTHLSSHTTPLPTYLGSTLKVTPLVSTALIMTRLQWSLVTGDWPHWSAGHLLSGLRSHADWHKSPVSSHWHDCVMISATARPRWPLQETLRMGGLGLQPPVAAYNYLTSIGLMLLRPQLLRGKYRSASSLFHPPYSIYTAPDGMYRAPGSHWEENVLLQPASALGTGPSSPGWHLSYYTPVRWAWVWVDPSPHWERGS